MHQDTLTLELRASYKLLSDHFVITNVQTTLQIVYYANINKRSLSLFLNEMLGWVCKGDTFVHPNQTHAHELAKCIILDNCALMILNGLVLY